MRGLSGRAVSWVKDLLLGTWALLAGRFRVNFYFSSVHMTDALAALWYALATLCFMQPGRSAGRSFKARIEKSFDTPHVFLYGSARSALFHHLETLGFPSGSEVIVTGYTCEVVPNAVIQAGLRPVYADIDPSTYCMSPESVQRVVTDRTRVLIIQHTYGIPASIDELLRIAADNDLYVIEDCAVSLGSRFKGRLTGTFGDASIFSFELSKLITSCRGGMLLLSASQPPEQVLRHSAAFEDVPHPPRLFTVRELLQLGMSGFLYRPRLYNVGRPLVALLFWLGLFRKSTTQAEYEGRRPPDYLHRLPDCQAALLLGQWKRLPALRAHSLQVAEAFREALCEIPGVSGLEVPTDDVHLVRYPVLTDERDALANALEALCVEPGRWFETPLSSPAVDLTVFGYTPGECPVSEQVGRRIINLPTHRWVGPGVVKSVVEAMTAVAPSSSPG